MGWRSGGVEGKNLAGPRLEPCVRVHTPFLLGRARRQYGGSPHLPERRRSSTRTSTRSTVLRGARAGAGHAAVPVAAAAATSATAWLSPSSCMRRWFSCMRAARSRSSWVSSMADVELQEGLQGRQQRGVGAANGGGRRQLPSRPGSCAGALIAAIDAGAHEPWRSERETHGVWGCLVGRQGLATACNWLGGRR